MVKLREEFHRSDDDSIDPTIWFDHIAASRLPQEVIQLQNAYHLCELSGEQTPTLTGLPSLQYGLAIADILENLGLDIDSIIAAMVFPCVHFGDLKIEDVEEHLGKSVANLVAGVEKMDAIRTLYSESQNPHNQSPTQIDKIRKMILAMVEDVRVVLIKLAERTVMMRSIKLLGGSQQQFLARETRDIYAPLANRLGIAQIKWELEDYTFRFLEPDTYKALSKSVDHKREAREHYINQVIATLKKALQSAGIHEFEVSGRAKHIYSIYRKMQKKNVDIDKIYDVSAVRILVDNIEHCYAALGIAHSLWEPIPAEFDDYIAHPKGNGYKSLHTAVIGPEARSVEIQIRTKQMHSDAELGVAAHWIYKEGGGKRSSYDQKIAWLRQLIEWQKEVSHEDQLESGAGTQFFEDRIYIFTPAGEIIDLALGATPLDFAYAIHTNIGHRCRGAKVNDKIVPLTYQLHTGEKVEILTAKEPNPSRDWMNPNLGYSRSSRTKAKILHWFKKQDYEQHLHLGEEIFDRELKRLHIGDFNFNKILERFNYKSKEDILAALGAGSLKVGQIIGAIESQTKEKIAAEKEHAPSIVAPPKAIKKTYDSINIQGIGNLLYSLANCCQPVAGDSIIGFITHGRGISIHRHDCTNILNASEPQKERFIEVNWGETPDTYPVDIYVHAYDRHGLVRDITTLLANEKVNIIALNTQTNKDEHTATITCTIEIPSLSQLSKILDRIHQLPNIITVERSRSGI